MISVKEIPVYWKQLLYDVLAIVRQLGIPTYFLTSCADIRWDKRPYIINKLNNLELTEEELNNLGCQKRCNLLNRNPVFSACHLQHKAGVFFRDIIFDGPLGKTNYAIRTEFQESCSPNVHSLLWIFNTIHWVDWDNNKCSVARPFGLSKHFELVTT